MSLARWSSFSSSSLDHSVFLMAGSSHSIQRAWRKDVSARRGEGRRLGPHLALLGRFADEEGGDTSPLVLAVLRARVS